MNQCVDAVESLPAPATRWQPEKVAATYDAERFSSLPGRIFNRLSRRAIRRAILAIEGGVMSALDLPCGTGRATAVIRDLVPRVVGADISLAMMRQAIQRLGSATSPPFIRCDVASQPFASGSFDVVTSIRFLMHLDAPSRQAALSEMGRVAARYVIVEYGCTSTWLRVRRRLRRAFLRLGGKRPGLTRALSWSEIRADVAAAGLQIDRVFPTAWGLSESVVLLLKRR